MLSDFNSEALILFPNTINTESRYMHLFQESIQNLIKVFNNEGVVCKALVTDTLSFTLGIAGFEYVNVLSEADTFFVRNNCMDMDNMPEAKYLQKYAEAATAKFPTKRGLTKDQRFSILQQREKFAVKEYLKECRLAVTFARGKNQNYKLESKAGDGRLSIFVNPNSFILSPYISGHELAVADVFDYADCTRPLNQWRVNNG